MKTKLMKDGYENPDEKRTAIMNFINDAVGIDVPKEFIFDEFGEIVSLEIEDLDVKAETDILNKYKHLIKS